MSRIGMQINQLRTKKGMTQKQLANKVGVSEKYINEVESGRKIINDMLIKKISKALDVKLSESLIYDDKPCEIKNESNKAIKANNSSNTTQEVWNDAFSSVLKEVPIYKYSLDKPIKTRLLPVVSNKIEGYSKDKVFFVEIEDDEMIGFRIAKGDIAFCYRTHEIGKNGTYLIEYNGKRHIRQIKRLDSNKILLISNKNNLVTDTISIKEILVLAKLIKLEINL